MDFLTSITAEVIAAILAAGVLGALAWLGARLFRRRDRERAAEEQGAAPEPRPLRVLVAASRPWDAEPWLDAEAEWEALCATLRSEAGAEPVPIRMVFLPSATQQALRAALQRGCDVLHFTGHGTAQGALLLEGDYGLMQLMDADRFLRLLPADREQRPCLVVLSACHSGAVGAALRKAGVDHVVAVDRTTPIPDRAAVVYAAAFYRALARGGRLDHAHRDGQNAAGLDKYAGDRSRPGEGPPVSERFRLLTRHKRARLARGRRGEFVCTRPQVAGPEFPRPRVPSLVGRARDLGQVAYYLSEKRLVTVHGLGGVGKTALARVLGRRLWETARFPGGLAWVELDDREGAAGLLEALRVRLSPDFTFPPEAETAQERAAALADRLALPTAPAGAATQRRLWVLDNFETVHGPEGVAVLRVLLERLSDLRLLVTARHTLGLPEETPHPLKELELAQAVALFEARCRVPLAKEKRPVVEAVCERLDRLPLPVEQAALWVNGQSPETLLAGLERSALALTPAEEAAYPERQRGLAVNFRYNFERIGAAGRRLWCCFAVFLGQPTYAALAQVAGFEDWEQGLDELTRWHLARREGERYAMLPTVREYAALMLREAGAELGLDEVELKAHHAAHYLDVAREEFTDEKYQRGEWATVEEVDGPDIFAAADWAVAELERAEGAPVKELLARWDELEATWEMVSPAGEWAHAMCGHVFRRQPPGGYRWLTAGLVAWRLSEAEESRARQALLCNEFGLIHKARGDYDAALEWYERSVVLKEELSDRAGLAATYNNIAGIHYARGDYAAALEWYERSVALKEELGDRAGLARTYNNIGEIHRARGDYEAALEWYERSVALCEALGDRAVLATTYNNIGMIHDARREYATALEWYERSVALKEELGDRAGLARTYNNIGAVHRARGEYAAALEWYERSVALCEALGDRVGLAATYNNIGAIHNVRGDYAAALEWMTKSLAILEEIGAQANAQVVRGNIAEVRRRVEGTAAD